MTVVWVLLAPLILVVGLASVASALFLILALGSAIFGGPFSAAERRLRHSFALRRERRDLDRGRWALASRDAPAGYRDIVTFGPVERTGARCWRVAREQETEVFFLHRGRARVVRCEDEELSVRAWLHRLEAELVARTTGPIKRRVIDDMESLRAAIGEANAFLPRPLSAPASAAYPDVMSALGARAGVRAVDQPDKAVLEVRFAAFCAAHGERRSLDDMREIFPEVEAARSWLAGSRLPRDARDDGDEPLQLYIAGTRWVLLCFSFDEPWIVGDYAHPAAYFFDEAVRPALAEYERAARLFDPFGLP